MRTLLLICCLGMVSHAAADNRYVIQVGAFKQAPAAVRSDIANYGDAVTATTAQGFVRLGVGYFASVAAAADTLQQVRAAGYERAFVRSSSGFSTSDARSVSVASTRVQSSFDSNSIIDTLSAEERAKLVLLDGQPHIKEGARFIPLSQYRRN